MRPLLRQSDGGDGSPLGTAVLRLQQLLMLVGEQPEQDGSFGVRTDTAVRQFQQAQGLSVDGVVGPNTWAAIVTAAGGEVAEDFAQATQFRSVIEGAASDQGVRPATLGGIGSRESRWGLALRPEGPAGTGDFAGRAPRPPVRPSRMPPDGLGFGRGLMQIDFDAFPFAQTGPWRDAAANIAFGARVLAQNVAFFAQHRPAADAIACALAAYNAGRGNVIRALDGGAPIDSVTTGGNYSVDVVARTAFFASHGWA